MSTGAKVGIGIAVVLVIVVIVLIPAGIALHKYKAYRGWQSYPYSGRNQRNRKKKIIFGAWNVHTLMDREASLRPERRTALIARELARYSIDIAALSETRLAEEGSVAEPKGGYTFF
ncbi:hypothetical protein MHYP_G00088840 [Metynnis hypsauchen]